MSEIHISKIEDFPDQTQEITEQKETRFWKRLLYALMLKTPPKIKTVHTVINLSADHDYILSNSLEIPDNTSIIGVGIDLDRRVVL